MARYRINVFNNRNDSEHQQVRRNSKMRSGPQVGDTVSHSDTGPFTVTGRTKRYVTGTTPEGRAVGQTGVGLFKREGLGS